MRHAVPAALVAVALAAALSSCSSTPAPKPTHHTTAAAIKGAQLEKELAWGECQQLVIRKLKLTDANPRKWSAQSEKPAGAAWVAVGHLATGPLAYGYQCTVKSDAKGTVQSEALDWIRPA